MTAFFTSLPKNLRMAFVLIQHLEPQHKSALAEILSRKTHINIREARNNLKVEPGHVYVIPPASLLAVARGKLKVTKRIRRADGRYLPVDHCMVSLAQERGAGAIGVILSGTGSDGTLGAKAIRARGGIVFAQSKATAAYFGMPSSAIEADAADFVLGPREIARKLVRIGSREYVRAAGRPPVVKAAEGVPLSILLLLRDLTGADCLHYKQTTIIRRIKRRMMFHSIKSYEEYRRYIEKNPSESSLLLKDILISVTVFFRDQEVFASLRKRVFPQLAVKRSGKDPVRIWVTACSSGEEVYSLAIALFEYMEEAKAPVHIQIFGTDISEVLIKKARAGVFGPEISEHVSPERLRRFFTRTETGFKIAKHIRDLCIFARHDVLNDPPLSSMDLVSCRNLLIYLDGFLQQKALSVLHYALRPKGVLVLGSAESVTALPGSFSVLDNKHKLFVKNAVTHKAVTAAFRPIRRDFSRERSKAEVDMSRIKAQSKKEKKAGKHPGKLSATSKEFARTVERLHALSEEKDTFNEELKAANEEIQSSNEELQSMNEELETSKEELQSTNEELLTLNEEMQNKNAELLRLNSDLSNVFASTNIPMIIVGNDMYIKRFTPTARKVMNLIPSDVDRPIGDIKLNINIANLEETILGVIEDMAPQEIDVQDKEGKWYSVRIRPYRTLDNKIEGAVITMIDINAVKRSREEVQQALDYSQAIIDTMKEPLVVLDKELRVISANKAFYKTFMVRVSDVEHKLFFGIGDQQWDKPDLRRMLGELLPKKSHFDNFEVSFDCPKIGKKDMLLNGRQIELQGKESPMILIVMEDITERKKAEELVRLSLEEKGVLLKELHHRVKNNLQIISSLLQIKLSASKDKAITEVFKQTQERINVMALAHQKLCESKDFMSIDISRYVQDLVKCLLVAYGVDREKVSVAVEAEKVSLKIDQAVPCGTIINELLTNALKYAFPAGRKGKIGIRIRTVNPRTLEIVVQDNGIGMPRGFNLHKTGSMGLSFVVSTVENQLGGRIELGRAEGAKFKCTFAIEGD